MGKKFTILIEDDWEVMGNGLGNVAHLQYLPSLYFMKLARRLGIQLTFMVDVAQQLQFKKYISSDFNLRLQYNLWRENVLLMKHYGFDVQLHLHPQWFNARRLGDYFYLGKDWNIGRYDKIAQENMIGDSIDYLERLLKPDFPDYKVVAFKGGSWGLQPSGDLLRSMDRFGIRLIMGVREGMVLPGNGVDYSSLEESFAPYYPDYDDICKVSEQRENIIIIPLQSVTPGFRGLAYLAADLFRRKISRKDSVRHYYNGNVPDEISGLSPVSEDARPGFPFVHYKTHLKIGNQPLSYLKSCFDQIMKKVTHIQNENIPLLIECHTKQFNSYYTDIEIFLGYIMDKYGDVIEFSNVSEYLLKIEKDPGLIRLKKMK